MAAGQQHQRPRSVLNPRHLQLAQCTPLVAQVDRLPPGTGEALGIGFVYFGIRILGIGMGLRLGHWCGLRVRVRVKVRARVEGISEGT